MAYSNSRTEKEIQASLNEVSKARTTLVIAHRLSTIRNADRILVMEHGSITEQGRHAELMSLKGRYYKLYTQQSIVKFSKEEQNWQA